MWRMLRVLIRELISFSQVNMQNLKQILVNYLLFVIICRLLLNERKENRIHLK